MHPPYGFAGGNGNGAIGAVTPTAASAAAAGVSWKSHIIGQVAARQQAQQGAFADIFTAYTRALAYARQLKQRVFQLEQEVMTTRQLSSLSATPGHPARLSMDAGSATSGGVSGAVGGVLGMVGLASGGGGMSAALQKQLEEKILKLQEDLTAAYRLQSENSHTSLRLKEQAEADEKALIKKEEELAEKTRQVVTLQHALANEREAAKQRHKHLEQTVELLRAEVQGSRAGTEALKAKVAQLTSENDELVIRMVKLAEEQAGSQSEMDRMQAELQKATHLAAAAAEAKRQAEEGRAIAPAEVDLTDMNAVIEHVAWATTCKVEIPSERKRTIRGHRGAATCARYNTAGTLLASAGVDGLVKVYDARTGVNRASLRGSKDAIMNVCFSPDDSLLLASGNDNISRVWSLKSSRVVHTLVGHTAKVWAASFTGDGERVVTGSHDRTLRIWDVREGGSGAGGLTRQIKCHSACNYLAVNRSSGGNLVASAHLDTHVRFWSLLTGELAHDLSDSHDGQVTSVEFSEDGLMAVTASRDNTVRVIDMRTYKTLQTMAQSSKTPYRNLLNWSRAAWSPDDKHVLAGGHNGDLFVWATETGRLEAILAGAHLGEGIYGGTLASPAAAAGPGAVASGLAGIAPTFGAGSSISSPASSSAAAVAAANAVGEQAISCVDWNRNGRQLMAADYNGSVHVWEDELVIAKTQTA